MRAWSGIVVAAWVFAALPATANRARVIGPSCPVVYRDAQAALEEEFGERILEGAREGLTQAAAAQLGARFETRVEPYSGPVRGHEGDLVPLKEGYRFPSAFDTLDIVFLRFGDPVSHEALEAVVEHGSRPVAVFLVDARAAEYPAARALLRKHPGRVRLVSPTTAAFPKLFQLESYPALVRVSDSAHYRVLSGRITPEELEAHDFR